METKRNEEGVYYYNGEKRYREETEKPDLKPGALTGAKKEIDWEERMWDLSVRIFLSQGLESKTERASVVAASRLINEYKTIAKSEKIL